MSQNLLLDAHKNNITKKVPEIKPGYTVEVDTIIREGNKQRVQKFKGLVISLTGEGANQIMTVRKISYGIGVEKKLPIHSPNVGAIKVIKTEETRRSKLYFMRSRVGKNAMRIKKGKAIFVTDEEFAKMMPEEVEVMAPGEETQAEQPTEVKPESSETAEVVAETATEAQVEENKEESKSE